MLFTNVFFVTVCTMGCPIDKTYTPSSHSRSQSTAWLLLSIATAPSLAVRIYMSHIDRSSRLPIIEFTHNASSFRMTDFNRQSGIDFRLVRPTYRQGRLHPYDRLWGTGFVHLSKVAFQPLHPTGKWSTVATSHKGDFSLSLLPGQAIKPKSRGLHRLTPEG